MDDEGGDWFGGDDEPAAEVAAPADKAPVGAVPAETGAPAAADETPVGDTAEEAPQEEEYLDPDKLLLFKHWIRPKFLQYKYLYDYRHNYYNDVIDYMDKKQRGLHPDLPHAQTWAERALRTYASKINRTESFKRTLEDTKLVTKTKLSGAFFSYHSKEYMSRRFTCTLG